MMNVRRLAYPMILAGIMLFIIPIVFPLPLTITGVPLIPESFTIGPSETVTFTMDIGDNEVWLYATGWYANDTLISYMEAPYCEISRTFDGSLGVGTHYIYVIFILTDWQGNFEDGATSTSTLIITSTSPSPTPTPTGSPAPPSPSPSPTPVPQVALTMGVYGEGTVAPSVGTHTYDINTQVTISATTGSGYTFSYWLFDDNTQSSSATLTLTMSRSRSALAVFTEIPPAPTPSPTPAPTPSPQEGILTGVVTSSIDGLPIADAWVYPSKEGVMSGAYVVTDSNGQYSINLVAGTYSVQISKSGESVTFQNVQIVEGQTTYLNGELAIPTPSPSPMPIPTATPSPTPIPVVTPPPLEPPIQFALHPIQLVGVGLAVFGVGLLFVRRKPK